jgi:hypothetical protein
MSPRLKIAAIRFARVVFYGALAGGISAALAALPGLGAVLPSPVFVLPPLTALLTAADKWVRAREAAG